MLTFSLFALVLMAMASTVTCDATVTVEVAQHHNQLQDILGQLSAVRGGLQSVVNRLDVLENLYLTPAVQNVARFRPTSQSSTYTLARGGPAASLRAVDGNYDTDYFGLSCTHTNQEAGRSWWQVDLEGFYNISSIGITNRGDCCSEILRDVVITVHDGDPRIFSRASVTQCAHQAAPFPAGVTTWLDCQGGPIRGRYVRITNAPNSALTLCEVQVMAVPLL